MDLSRVSTAAGSGRECRRARGIRAGRGVEPVFRRHTAFRRAEKRSSAGLLDGRNTCICAADREDSPQGLLMGPAFDFAELRKTEFGRLDATGSVYMDYTGAALYPESLVCRSARRLNGCVFGNPHSESGPSLASTDAMNEARRLTRRFLNADESKYDVVFTANASGGMRLLAEAFPFRRESRLVLTADNHNSVNGLRVRARRRGAAVQYVPLTQELRAADVREFLPAVRRPSLLAYPAQSNFSGVQHPLEWIGLAQRQGYRVLLDAAAFVPSNPLSLAEFPADFVAL